MSIKKTITIFASLAIAIALTFNLKDSALTENNNSISIGFIYLRKVADLDPVQVKTLTDATILRNLYSSLFDYDLNGNIVTSLAESFSWENGTLKIKLKKQNIGSDGNPITAYDAEISLRRLMLDGENLHGDLKNIICPGHTLKKILDPCPGIKSDDDFLYITPSSEILAKQLIQLLASVDYRIIPARSIDMTSNFPKIINYKITSGAYSLHEQIDEESFILKANENHFLFSEDMPLFVKAISVLNKPVDELFTNGIIDLVPTTVVLTKEVYNSILEKNQNLNIQTTFNLMIRTLIFTKNAIKDFTAGHRFKIAKLIEQRLLEIRYPKEKETFEFFQSFGEGYLNNLQKEEIKSARDKTYDLELPKRASFSINPSKKNLWLDFLEKNKEIEARWIKTNAYEYKHEDRPDVFTTFTDVAFNSSAAILAYSLKQGYFGIYDKEADDWFKKFLSTESREEQIKQVNELHFNALKNCYIYPIGSSPYIAIANKKWKVTLNPYFAATPFWLIRQAD
jgi:hypothetical protein